MKVAQVQLDGRNQVILFWDGKWRRIREDQFPNIRSVKSLIQNWETVSIASLVSKVVEPPFDFLSPVSSPGKIICVGKNYAEHVQELGGEIPELPVIFNKLPSSLIGNEQEILLPDFSNKVDYEAELVVVIGKPGKNITRKNAMHHVFGYTIGNDVTARDWQKGKPGGQWLLGKTLDTFAPLGPYIVTTDELDDPNDLEIVLKLNGTTMQHGNTSQLIFKIDFLISHISRFFALRAGDLLFTGTPAGVGAGRDPQVYLSNGDKVEIEISRIGILSNSVSKN